MRPPTHGVDDAMEYVDITGPWDLERLQNEVRAMEEAGEDPDHHPLRRYFSGLTRYSLDAEGNVCGESRKPREYLKPDKKAVVFTLRRLGFREYRDCQAYVRRGEEEKAAEEATRYGVYKADGIKLRTVPGVPLSDEDMQRIWDLDPSLMDRLGGAALTCSRPLDASEGKR